MSWREVLESILTPLDLGLFAFGDYVYLRDTHTMGAGGTQKYRTMDGLQGGSSGIPAPITLDWVLDQSTISYEKALNRASVKFNKYKYDKVSFPITEATVGGNFTTHTMTDPDGKEYTERRYSTCVGYDMTGVPAYDFVLVYDNETGRLIDSFLRLGGLNSDTVRPAFKIDTGVLMYSGEGRASLDVDFCLEKLTSYRTPLDEWQPTTYLPDVEAQYRIGDRYINSLTAWTYTPAHVTVKLQPIWATGSPGVLNLNRWINSGEVNAGYSTQTMAGFTVPLNSDS